LSEQEQADLPHPGKNSRWAIIALVLLVTLPVGYHLGRGEADRWRAAAVMESWLDGNKQQAISELQQIVSRLPDDRQLKLVLAEWILALGATDRSQQKADQALDLIQEIPENYRSNRWQTVNQHCLLALGKPDEALKAYQEANPANQDRSASELFRHRNALAYFQALANSDLRLALRNSNLVVRDVYGTWNGSQDTPLTEYLQVQYCAALVYRRQMERYAEDVNKKSEYAQRATSILSEAIDEIQSEYERLCKLNRLAEALPGSPSEFFRSWLWNWLWPADRKGTGEDAVVKVKDQANDSAGQGGKEQQEPPLAKQKEDIAHALAALLTLRALIHQDVDEQKESFDDRRRVLKLGYDPESIAGKMPDFRNCVIQLQNLAQVLDTRGCVYLKLNAVGAAGKALIDLDMAVLAQQAYVDVSEVAPRTLMESSLDPREQTELYIREPQRSLATLLFHRSWARNAMGQPMEASTDLAAIRRLGFVPGYYLF